MDCSENSLICEIFQDEFPVRCSKGKRDKTRWR